MPKVILNRRKTQAEEIIAEEQARFRAGRSAIEQIFNLRIPCEKYHQRKQNLYNVFIDYAPRRESKLSPLSLSVRPTVRPSQFCPEYIS